MVVVVSSLTGIGFNLAAGAKVVAIELAAFFRIGPAATGFGGSLSLALLGAGHLMGLAVGIAMLVGVIIAWGVATPLLTLLQQTAGPAADAATSVWRTQVRFIGAGAIGVAAIWTLGKLIAPILTGLKNAMAAQERLRAGEDLPRTERDIPLPIMIGVSLACLVPMGFLVNNFLAGTPLAAHAPTLIVMALVYVVLAGFLVAAVCGYMAGLIGTSNSPVSGVAILAVLGAAVGLATLAAMSGWVDAGQALQDLKTGQLVDATPWRQQLALIIGVVAGSLAIAPVLDLLNQAYGFAGAPNINAIAKEPLAAPQATLISTLAKGVIQGDLDWGLLGIGGLLGAGLVAIDETLRRTTRHSLPPLAVGIAIYLPLSVSVPAIIGAFVGSSYDRWADKSARPEAVKRMGVLLASGLIVGESLFSVALAGLIVATGKGEPLGLVSDFETPGIVIGILVVIALVTALYRWTRAKAETDGGLAVIDEPPEAAPR